MADDRRPDWEYWKEVPNWTILEAVTLSMDRDPEDKQSNWAEFLGSTKFKKRLSLAMRNLDDNGKLTVTWTVPGDRAKWEVTHASFAAQAVGWWKGDVPPELAALAEPVKRDAEIREWPWGSRETKLLGHLAEAAKELWCRYDPTDATTAPTNIQVQDFLINRNVSKRVAEIMAQILRADKLPKGNHKR